MNELQQLIREQGTNIQIFIGKETTDDPNYDTKSVAYLNPFPIRALVSDISSASATWRMMGTKTNKVKEVTCNKRHRDLIEKSRKIKISGDFYYGYRPANGSKIQIKEAGDYIIMLVTTDETL